MEVANGPVFPEEARIETVSIPRLPFWFCLLEWEPNEKGLDDCYKNMDELSSLSEYVCDGSHTHGQSRGEALKLAENYTFTLTDFIHECFRSRANQAQTAKTRKRLALPAMSRRSDDSKMSITEKMNARALKSAGLKTVPQQSNMSEWLAFRKCLDVEGDRHAGWEDIFSTVLR